MYSNKPKELQAGKVRDIYNTAHYSTGKAAASLTSTVMEPSVVVEPGVQITSHLFSQPFWRTTSFDTDTSNLRGLCALSPPMGI